MLLDLIILFDSDPPADSGLYHVAVDVRGAPGFVAVHGGSSAPGFAAALDSRIAPGFAITTDDTIP